MKLIELHWTDNSGGVGHVKYTKAFNEAYDTLQLDMLMDCIADLQNKYEEVLAQHRRPKEKNI
jgi:hypothetical protein